MTFYLKKCTKSREIKKNFQRLNFQYHYCVVFPILREFSAVAARGVLKHSACVTISNNSKTNSTNWQLI